MAAGLPAGDDNLVLRAARAMGGGAGAAITLEKVLPVASGIGGGSADAAATLAGAGRALAPAAARRRGGAGAGRRCAGLPGGPRRCG